MVGTFGVVRGSSKKQRVAKKNLKANKKAAKELKKANDIAEAQLVAQSGKNEPPTQPDKYTELERLASLKDKGVITEAEFETEKKKLLG